MGGYVAKEYTPSPSAGTQDDKTVNVSTVSLQEHGYCQLDHLESQVNALNAGVCLQQDIVRKILDENRKRRSSTARGESSQLSSEHSCDVNGKRPKSDHGSDLDRTRQSSKHSGEFDGTRQSSKRSGDLDGTRQSSKHIGDFDRTRQSSTHGSVVDTTKKSPKQPSGHDCDVNADIHDESKAEVLNKQDTVIDELLETVLQDSRKTVLLQARILVESVEIFKSFIETTIGGRPRKQGVSNELPATKECSATPGDNNAVDEQHLTHCQSLTGRPGNSQETIQLLQRMLNDSQHNYAQKCNLLTSTEAAKQMYVQNIDTLNTKNRKLETENETFKRRIQIFEKEKSNENRKLQELERAKLKIQDLQTEINKLKRHDPYQSSTPSRNPFSGYMRKTAFAQVYCPRRGDLSNMVSAEVTSMLTNQFSTFQTDLTLIPCENVSELSMDKPGLVLCINASRLGTDVSNALKGVTLSPQLAVVILHHKDLHALPNQPSDRVLTSPEYKSLGGIFDMAFLTGKGLYPCDMNNTAVESIVGFIRHHNNV